MRKYWQNAIEEGLRFIINSDQRGFMKSRQMSTNIRTILDLMKYCEEEEIQACIINLDFQKCFDKIEHTCIFGSLEYFGFANYLKEWVSILYDDFSAVIQNNGYFSKEINIQKSVHQGGCASSLLFLLCAEMLAIELRNSESIKGIPVNEIINLLGQFADDMDVYQLYDQKCINAVFQTIADCGCHSGFTVNYDKTQIYRIGLLCNANTTFISQRQVSWTSEPIVVLGISIDVNDENVIKLNYGKIMSKVKSILQKWTKRNLSLIGKVLIINTLIASLFVHKMQVLPSLPETFFTNIEREFEIFLWNGRKPKIPLKQLQALKSDGGLKLVDLHKKDKAIKASWVEKLKTEEKLSNLVYRYLQPLLKDKIWEVNLSPQDAKLMFTGINKFWNEVLYTWAEIRWESFSMNKMLWYNSEIRVGDKPIFWPKQIKKGLMYINQLYDNSELMSYKKAFECYGLDIMSYNTMLSAIPKYLKIAEKMDPPRQTITAAKAYIILSEQEIRWYKKKEAWERELEQNIPVATFVSFFKEIYQLTNIAKYRSFQYRLLHRAIVTNIHLMHWRMRQTNMCSFCEVQKETYAHLFFNCVVIRNIWEGIRLFLMMLAHNENVQLTYYNVMFDQIVTKKENYIVKFLCIMVKQLIYRNRCLGKKVT